MSARFRFRLDAALRQRERQEKAVQLALHRTQQRRQAEAAEVNRLRCQITAASAAPAQPGRGFDTGGRMIQLLFMDRTRQQLGRQQQVLAQWDSELLRLGALLRQASARKKALERLRVRRRAEYDQEEQRRQDREADELVTLRFGRTERAGGNIHESFAG